MLNRRSFFSRIAAAFVAVPCIGKYVAPAPFVLTGDHMGQWVAVENIAEAEYGWLQYTVPVTLNPDPSHSR